MNLNEKGEYMKFFRILLLNLVSTAGTILAVFNLPDFDISLGKDDPYFSSFYANWQKRHSIRYIFWYRMRDRNPTFKQYLTFCRNLYNKNKGKILRSKHNEPRIPMIVHQIWLGSPFPDKYKAWQKTWQSMPGWQYKLWTDKDIEKFGLQNRDLYYASKNYGQRADIARVEILNRFGGLYVDVDFECIKPQIFTALNKTFNFYAGLEPLDLKYFWISNAIIGSAPNHPVLKGYINELRLRWRDNYQDTVYKTGPTFFAAMCYAHLEKDFENAIVLPQSFLFPLGLFQSKNLYRMPRRVIKKQVCKEETAAIHWWAGSWSKPSGQVKHK